VSRFSVAKLLIVAASVVVGLVLFAALSVHLYGAHKLASVSRQFETEVGPLSLQALVKKKLPPERNSVTWLRPGVLATVYLTGDQDVVGSLFAEPFGTWPPEETAKLREILDRNGPALALLDRARGIKESNWDIDYTEGMTAKIPNLLAAMNVSKLLTARGRMALAEGDRETALASVEMLGALARSHEAERATIVFLIGLAIEKNQIALVHEIVASPSTTPAELDRVEASFCNEDLTRAMHQTMRGSAAAAVRDFHDGSLLQQIHGVLYRTIGRPLSRLFAASAVEAHREAERSVGAPVKAPLGPNLGDDRERGWFDWPLDAVSTNLTSVAARATATSSARQLAILAIALRRDALATGSYPASLPSIEGVSPDDPLTGGTRAYAVRPNGSAELRSTTTEAIVRSIAPGSQLSFDALYNWSLPASGSHR
jgi:hypothetical protein